MNKRAANRSMFRRILRRLLFANRGRLFVILLALSAGAAVSAALLNLQVDAKRRISSEFRSFGANVLVTPKNPGANISAVPGLTAASYDKIPKSNAKGLISKAEFLYGVVSVTSWDKDRRDSNVNAPIPVVVVGYTYYGIDISDLRPSKVFRDSGRTVYDGPSCLVGKAVASRLGVAAGGQIRLQMEDRWFSCYVTRVDQFGGPEDSQVFVGIIWAEHLLNRKDRLDVLEVNVPGNAADVSSFTENLQHLLPDAEVRPLRQFSEAQAKIYSRISGLLTAATTLILALTALCVMAAMTNIAAERRNDVGMMKAIGGSARRVLNLFLTEAVILGLAGGLIGAAAGIALSVALGKAVFGVAAAPRLIVYPISVSLTVIVAILGAYPLRRLVNVRPATIFRGDA